MKQYANTYNLKNVWPILSWAKCEKCMNRFRRESGWANTALKKWTYVCLECCPTPEDAAKILLRPKQLKIKVKLTYCPKCLGRLNNMADRCHRDGCNFRLPADKVAETREFRDLFCAE